jgi:hypothetical protein
MEHAILAPSGNLFKFLSKIGDSADTSQNGLMDYEFFHMHLLFPPSNRERLLSFEAKM